MAVIPEDVTNARDQINELIGRLGDRNNLDVSYAAAQIIAIAIAAVAKEPSRYWPPELLGSENDRNTLQSQVIQGLGYHLVSLKYQILQSNRADASERVSIDVYDAISYSSRLSHDCCMIKIPPNL